jgi:hypothetical protein
VGTSRAEAREEIYEGNGMKVRLNCTHEQYHSLSLASGNARDGSKVVKVDIAALAALIADHGKLIAFHNNEIEGYK